jgi:hypothetical protein
VFLWENRRAPIPLVYDRLLHRVFDPYVSTANGLVERP